MNRTAGGVMRLSAILGLVLVLSACTPVAPIYLGLVDGDLAVQVCEDLEVERISIGAVTEGSNSQGDIIWRVLGSADLNAGDVVEVGRSPAGFDTVEVAYAGLPPDVRTVTASLQEVDVSGKPVSGPAGSFDASLLREGSWLASDGRLVDDPC